MRRTRLVSVNVGPTAGGAGASTATAYSSDVVRGEVMSVYVKYLDSPPAGTTDVTVSMAGTDGVPAQTILALSNQATDKLCYPRALVQDTTGTNIAGEYTPLVIHDRVKVVMAQANDGDGCEVWLVIRD